MREELAPVELRWPEREDATAYRVLGRDAEQGAMVLDTGSLDEPRCLLSALEISPQRPLRLRIDVQHADGEWTPYGPAFLLPAAAPHDGVHWLRWSDDDGAGIHRLLVYDYARHEAVLDEIVLGTRYALVRNLQTPGSELRWRAQPWRGDHWGDAEWRALPFELLISEPAPEQVRPPRGEPRLLLLFTVDTEGGLHQMRHPDPARTIDQLVFGDFGGGESLGVGLQMDLLEQFGFRGTFFVDVLLEYTFGREALERTIQAIAGRGHEVELHVHDMHLARSEDPEDRELAGALLRNASGEHIRRVLDRSVGLFTERIGRPPRAFRAGAYHVGDALLALLPEFGIAFDSSLNRFRHAKVSDWMMTRTQPFRVGPLLELPVSWQLRPDREGKLSKRLYAPNRTPGDALTTAPAPTGGDPLTAVYVSHSFSLMRKAPGDLAEIRRWREATAKLDDEFATRMANMPDDRLVFYEPCPDEGMVAHARAALERIAAREDATCVTFEELEGMAAGWWRARDRPVDPVFVLQEADVRARLAGSRIYSPALLDRLTTARSPGRAPRAPAVDELGDVPIGWSGRTVLVTGPDRREAIAWLQSRLATAVDGGEVPSAGDDQYDAIVWLSGLDRLGVSEQGETLARCLQRLVPEAPCVIGTSTLGLVDHDPSLPYAAELLFPSATLQRCRAAPAPSRAPWDVPTLVSLIQDAGFDMLDVRRHARADEELELLARDHDKLRWLDPGELSCDRVLLVAQRPIGPVRLPQRTDGGRWYTLPDRWTALAAGRRVIDCAAAAAAAAAAGAPLGGLGVADESVDVVVMSAGLAGCSPAEVEERFTAAYRALCPGGDLLARLDAIPVSASSGLVCAMRAGFEVVESSRVDGALEVRLVRPFEAAELDAL